MEVFTQAILLNIVTVANIFKISLARVMKLTVSIRAVVVYTLLLAIMYNLFPSLIN
jgi:hypothetical protein